LRKDLQRTNGVSSDLAISHIVIFCRVKNRLLVTFRNNFQKLVKSWINVIGKYTALSLLSLEIYNNFQ